MAIQVEFTGYINSIKTFDWGTVYDISHAQRKQNDAGEWETVGTDYFSVVGEPGFSENQRVTVKGKLKTKRFDKRDGSKGISLEVRAEEISAYEKTADAPF